VQVAVSPMAISSKVTLLIFIIAVPRFDTVRFSLALFRDQL
jgi:hypothetical protein